MNKNKSGKYSWQGLSKRLSCVQCCTSAFKMAGNGGKSLKMIVFDLDYTLWPFYVDCHVDPPFAKRQDGKVYDSHGAEVTFYQDTPKILAGLKSAGYKIGIASRSSAPRAAESLLQLFDWNKYIDYKQIYPGSKVTHFNRIQEDSQIAFDQMMFFDDEYRNIVDTSKLGVDAVFVDDGVSWTLVQRSIHKYDKKKE